MITFTRRARTLDPSTGRTTVTETTVTGTAIMVAGDPHQYAALGLIEEQAPTLLFSPTSYNLRAGTDEFVKPGDVVDWLDTLYTVRAVRCVAPDGFVIVARIVVSV